MLKFLKLCLNSNEMKQNLELEGILCISYLLILYLMKLNPRKIAISPTCPPSGKSKLTSRFQGNLLCYLENMIVNPHMREHLSLSKK